MNIIKLIIPISQVSPVKPVVVQSQVMLPSRSCVQLLPLHASPSQGSRKNNQNMITYIAIKSLIYKLYILYIFMKKFYV